MAAHRARVIRRGGGHVAQCVAGGCPAVTGVWDTNAEARQSLDLQAHEEALDAVAAAAEGKHPETRYEIEGTTPMIASPTDNRQQLEAADEPASAQLRRRVESCAEPQHEGIGGGL